MKILGKHLSSNRMQHRLSLTASEFLIFKNLVDGAFKQVPKDDIATMKTYTHLREMRRKIYNPKKND